MSLIPRPYYKYIIILPELEKEADGEGDNTFSNCSIKGIWKILEKYIEKDKD